MALRMVLPRESRSPLETLGHDILYQICSIFVERIPNPEQFYPTLVRRFLPDLVALSVTNKALREISKPVIFEEVVIRQMLTKEGYCWAKVVEKLEILAGPVVDILQYVKTFEFSIRTGHDTDYIEHPNAPYLLADVLSKLPKLQTLTFDLPDGQVRDFGQVFQARSIQLPRVNKLVLGSASEFMISASPNVCTVWTSDYFGNWTDHVARLALVDSVLTANNVTELRITNGWSLDMAKALGARPSSTIKRIVDVSPSHDSPDISITVLIKHLSCLQNLEEIAFGDASDLEMGYSPPWCGNAYQGRHGFELRQSLVQKLKEVEMQIIETIEEYFGEEKKLRILRIGTGILFERKEKEVDGEDEDDKWRVGKWVRAKRYGDDEKEEVYDSEEDKKAWSL